MSGLLKRVLAAVLSIRKGKRRFAPEDLEIVGRILRFAYPYRGRIALGLVLGLVAGLFTALNMVALVPVLDIVLKETDQAEIDRLEENLAEREVELAEADGLINWVEPWLEREKAELRLEWTHWIVRKEEKAIYILAGILVLAQVFKSIIEFFSKYILQRSFYEAIVRLRTAVYAKVLTLDLPDFHRITSGDLIARMNNDLRAVRMVFTSLVGDVVLQPFTMIFILAAMLVLNWQMTLIVVFGLPLIVLPISYVGKKLRTMGKRDEEEDAKILSYTQEVIQGLVIVKAFTGERRELHKFKNLSREVAKRQIRREKYRLYAEPFVEISATLAMAAVLCVGAYLILKSDSADMDPSEFLVYIFLLTRFYPPLKKISNTFIKLQKSLASGERIFEVIDMPTKIIEKPNAVELQGFNDQIDFDRVTFAYREGLEPVLREFSLSIGKGQKVALVGRTGAGKSTVARLLPRFYDLTGGSIRVDNVDIREFRIRSLRSMIALVSQDTILFDDTVANNINYGKPDATREEIIEAAKAAHAHEFIEQLPQGYDTEIGERGGQLSGGQRQRLAIARALLADKPILVLDEATSALDTESEAKVQAAIERLMENRTVIVIAHRLSTVCKADKIVVMEQGRIVEQGNHEELLAAQGRYYDLVHQAELEGEPMPTATSLSEAPSS